jgi:outer membrane protein assembly factor BamB
VLVSINIHTSKKSWSFPTENQINSSPVFYKDALYFGCIDGNIYSLDANNGQLRWKFKTNGPITGSPFVAHDTVYIGSTDKHLYAIPA